MSNFPDFVVSGRAAAEALAGVERARAILRRLEGDKTVTKDELFDVQLDLVHAMSLLQAMLTRLSLRVQLYEEAA